MGNGGSDARRTANGEQAQKGEKAHYSLNPCLVPVHCIEAGHAYHTESTTLATLIQICPVHNEETHFLQSYRYLGSTHQTPLALTCTCLQPTNPSPSPSSPELEILLIPIPPALPPLLLHLPQLLLPLVLLLLPPPRLLLRLDVRALLLHQLLRLLDACLLLGPVVLAHLVRDYADAAPRRYGPVGRNQYRLCKSSLAYVFQPNPIPAWPGMTVWNILPIIAARLPPANPAASP